MRVGDLVRFKNVVLESFNREEFSNWLGVVVKHDYENACVIVQWIHYDTASPEYCDDLEVICVGKKT